MIDTPLALSVRLASEIREQLKAVYDLEDGDEALEDTIAGESDLNEKLAALAREALRCESMAEGMKALIKANTDRKSRLEHKAEKLRGIINWAMTDSGSKKIRMDDMTLSLSEGRPPVIIDESKPMPDAYCRIKKEPDRTLIRARLESGEELEFAAFGNAKMTLVIRG